MNERSNISRQKNEFIAELNSLSDTLNSYSGTFPQEIVKGLPYFGVCDAKCKSEFLNLSAKISDSLETTDGVASKTNSLLLCFDSENSYENVRLCGEILLAYENYKNNACHFINEGYRLFNQKNNVSAYALFSLNRILSEAIINFKAQLDRILK